MEYLRKINLPILVICLSSISTMVAQMDNVAFSRLTKEMGLPVSTAHQIEMDNAGFAWIGMQDCVVRWDGRNIRRYQTLKDDTTSLSCTFVKTILKDPDGTLWMGTIGGGVNRFDPQAERFYRYPCLPNEPNSLSDPNVWDLYLDSKNDLWVGTFNSGLNRFNRTTNAFVHFPIAKNLKNEQEAFRQNTVRDIVEDKGDPNILWLATNDGIVRFNKTNGFVTHFESQASKSEGMTIYKVFMDKPGELWAGTGGGGLVRFDTYTCKWDYFTPNAAAWQKRSISDNIFMDIMPKNENELWVCSEDMGFGIFYKKTGTFQFFRHDPDNLLSILANTANSVFEDSQHRLWITHFNKGVSILDPQQLPFLFQPLPLGDCTSFDKGQITDFEYDAVGNRYFVTGRACDGLFMLDQNKKFVKKIQAKGNEGAYTNYQTVKTDRQGRIWVGGIGSLDNKPADSHRNFPLWVMSAGESKLRPFAHRALPKGPYNVYDIREDRNGNLWLATDYLGLVKIDFVKDTVIAYVKSPAFPYAPSPYVHCRHIIEDKKGCIWVATQGEGVFCFDPQTEKCKQWMHLKTGFNGLVETRVNALLEDDRGLIWLATSGNGIQLLDPSSKDALPIVTQLATQEGLPSPRINNIVRDPSGDIWVTTEGGLCRYDTKLAQFVPYGQQDGVLHPNFFEQGLRAFSNGDIFIGQNTGFYTFEPHKQTLQKQASTLVFSSFKVHEKERFFEKGLNYLSKIMLQYDENYFTIAFSDLAYTRGTGKILAYMLEGYDKDWIFPNDNRSMASYTGIPPGEYTFRVKLTNRDAETLVENDGQNSIALPITLLPPWWGTWWFYLLCSLGISGIIYGWFWYQLRHALKIERMRVQISSDLHDDVGTLLSGLAMQSEMLELTAREKDKAKLRRISQMSRDAMAHMRDTVWAIDARKDKLEDLLDRMREYAEETLTPKDFICDFHIENVSLKHNMPSFTRQQIYLIYKEAVTNIAKHSNGNKVDITLKKSSSGFTMLICDNGNLPEKKYKTTGSGINNMHMRAKKMGGSLEIVNNTGFSVVLNIPSFS